MTAEDGSPRIGDRLRWRDKELEVTGVVVSGYDSARPLDRTIEYLLVRQPNDDELVWQLDALPAGVATVTRGPGMFDGLEPLSLSPGWVARFADLVESRPGEPAIARAAAERLPGQLIVVGGTVRDGLRGVDRRRGDIDLAGTLRSARFRRLVDEVFGALFDGEPSVSDDRWRYSTSPDQFVQVESSEPHHVVDYAPLRCGHRAHPLSRVPDWVFGSTLRADVAWRDLTCNTVVLDLRSDGSSALYDPTDGGLGLLDLGLTPTQLQGDPPSRPSRPMCLRPIDLPPGAPARHAVLHLVRVLDHLARFTDEGADTRPVRDWAAAHRELLLTAAAHREEGTTELLVVKELMSLTTRERTLAWIRRHKTEMVELLGRQLARAIRTVVPAPTGLRGASQGPRLRGVALQVVEKDGGLGAVVGPSRPTPAAAAAFFGDDLAGYEHQIVEVEVSGGGASPLLGLIPVDRDEVTYLELDGSLQPITCNDEELARWRAEDG